VARVSVLVAVVVNCDEVFDEEDVNFFYDIIQADICVSEKTMTSNVTEKQGPRHSSSG
jgi:hypothetical protein